ncbi:hypothetical protein GCM10009527_009220 [Actinomadura nitritigenes]|uniref:Uncharacterized protein n=1 Tax=Actinomadura nitritigenes TaxID=134602 RepID=A0ABS3R0U1_9ACTN|nr:hypothetical protein [Actinomadura nitritigenes]MBO2439801.1 hypothetical protein [Actinomadura nitritigenes]
MSKDERRRLARKAIAFDVLMANLPTAGHPDRGDPEAVRRALEVLDEEEPAGEAGDSPEGA